MSDCLFCAIVAGDIPANIVLQTDTVLAFHDVQPQAPTHILVIPKQHFADLAAVAAADPTLAADLMLAAAEVAHTVQLDQAGYRLVVNTGIDGGQSVYHCHVHVLGGRRLQWPPG